LKERRERIFLEKKYLRNNTNLVRESTIKQHYLPKGCPEVGIIEGKFKGVIK